MFNIYFTIRLILCNLLKFYHQIHSIKPHPRSGHRAIATESDLWIWGGYYPAVMINQNACFKKYDKENDYFDF